jgi:hypothetical protein
VALAGAAFLVGAAVAMADNGPSGNGSTTTAPPPPPPDTGGSSSPSTTSSTPATSTDSTPPKGASHLRVSTPKPGRNVLSWRLPPAPDIAVVIVARGRGRHCPAHPPTNGTQIGGFSRRTTQIDTTERDTTEYCYAVFTLDAVGNWGAPVTRIARNPGDTKAPGPVTAVTAVVGKSGAIHLTWTNPAGAAHIVVVRGHGSTCPSSPTDGARVGTRQLRKSEIDTAVQSAPGTYCYAVFAYDTARNRSDIATATVTHQAVSPTTTGSSPAPSSGGSSSSLSDIVAIIGGGAIVLAGLAFITLRLVRREWEWHSRTGYGIRDLMSIDVRDYDRQALVIPAIIGVCIAGALVVLLLSL